jgi:hypothetical protein
LGETHSHFYLFFYMKAVTTTPNAARGEVSITIAGVAYPVRFGMNVMRDFTKLTGRAPSEFGQLLADDYNEALSGIVYCAVKRYVGADNLPTGFDQDAACDLIEDLSLAEADAVADAIAEAVTVGNPLLTSLTAKVVSKSRAAALTQPESGTNSSTSLSVS